MATHENLEQFHKAETASEKNFCLVFAAVFAIIGFYPLLKSEAFRSWSLGVSIAFFILAFTRPKLIAPLNVLWAQFGVLLGKIMTPIIMAAIYFSVFLLTGLVLKLLGKDLLRLKPDKDAKTYWLERDEQTFTPDSLKNQF